MDIDHAANATNEPGVQEELLSALLTDVEEDTYIVIPVDVLSRQLSLDWDGVAREHRGEVRLGWLQFRHLRSLQQLGFLVTTKPGRIEPDR